jgi:hypothetical protein
MLQYTPERKIPDLAPFQPGGLHSIRNAPFVVYLNEEMP